MPAIASKHVCTFDELPRGAQKNALERMRDLERQEFGACAYLYDTYLEAAKILGIELCARDIRWSGFSSQGDGASFVGSYSHAPQSPCNIRKNFPKDTDLHEIADGLDALQNGHRLLTGHRISARITRGRGNYCHKYTMECTANDSNTGEELNIELEARILDLMRDFAQWIYDGLEKEYNYRLSDEAIKETIQANNYQFQAATGKVV